MIRFPPSRADYQYWSSCLHGQLIWDGALLATPADNMNGLAGLRPGQLKEPCPKLADPSTKPPFPQIKPTKINLSLFGRFGNVDVLAMPASGSHLRQGDVKRKGADLLVAPLKLNVRLSKCGPRSVGPLRGLVKPRNNQFGTLTIISFAPRLVRHKTIPLPN